LGHPIPSPALLGRIGDHFRAETRRFDRDHDIPILRLGAPDRSRWDDRKLDHVRPHLQTAEREGRFGVVAIVVAKEFQGVWSARNPANKPGVAALEFVWEKRRVGAYNFYTLDREFGRRSSRSAPTAHGSRGFGSTGTSGPNAMHKGRHQVRRAV
jgi:hypothetical protein